MKKAIMILFAFTLCFYALAGVQRVATRGKNAAGAPSTTNLLLPGQDASVGKSFASVLSDEDISSALSAEERQMLRVLQFDDYRHMKIAEFQNKVWEVTDTPEYSELLSRLSKDEALYALRDSDETAAFVYYVLNPLTKENWQTHTYNGVAFSEAPAGEDNARLEYTYTMTILDAEKIMVKDYCDTRMSIVEAMNSMMLNRMKEELQSEEYMLAELKTFVDSILPDFQSPELTVAIEYAYFPLSAAEEPDRELRQRTTPNGTEDDYRSLLALKAAGYEDTPLADFNAALLAWADEDYERMERIDEDGRFDDLKVTLSEDERSFVEWTVFLSGKENAKYVQGIYTAETEGDPRHDQYLPVRFGASGGRSGYCSLYYKFSWHISDKEAITVGERDRQISGMMQAVQEFWDEIGTEELSKMSEADIVAKLREIMSVYSTDNITITTSEDHVQFENIKRNLNSTQNTKSVKKIRFKGFYFIFSTKFPQKQL